MILIAFSDYYFTGIRRGGAEWENCPYRNRFRGPFPLFFVKMWRRALPNVAIPGILHPIPNSLSCIGDVLGGNSTELKPKSDGFLF